MELKKLISNFETDNMELIMKSLNTNINGLNEDEAEKRLDIYGLNQLESEWIFYII